jgi:glutamate N-acetyltransferase/amino-acid N-acetyltransferase
VTVAGVEIFRNGAPLSGDFDALLKPHLEKRDIDIEVDLGAGEGFFVLLASDLTHEYITINADYRS